LDWLHQFMVTDFPVALIPAVCIQDWR
jgi:hypothetical protein